MPIRSIAPASRLFRRGAPALAMAAALILVAAVSSFAREASKPAAPAVRLSPPEPGIYHLGELRRIEAARLDRSRCFLLQAISPIDLHGGHLPANTSLELSEAMTEEVARRLLKAKPDWSVVIMPSLPVGAGSTGEIGNVYFHSSSVMLDMFTFRRMLGAWILGPGENAYTNRSVISFHIDPQHLRAISNACDYYVQNYGMNNLNVMSYLMASNTSLNRSSYFSSRSSRRRDRSLLEETISRNATKALMI